jgi:hypothetical protein
LAIPSNPDPEFERELLNRLDYTHFSCKRECRATRIHSRAFFKKFHAGLHVADDDEVASQRSERTNWTCSNVVQVLKKGERVKITIGILVMNPMSPGILFGHI